MVRIDARLRLWMEMQLKPDRVAGGPRYAAIEPGAICNLHCPFCPTGNGTLGLPQKFLTPERFETVLDRLGPDLRSVLLFHWGEPLLNPGIHAIVGQASARGIAADIHTNFSLPGFDAAAAGRLVESGLPLLVVACDGASQETYEQYRVGGRFDLVLRNIKLLLAERERRSSPHPEVIWRFLLHPGNEHEKALATRTAAELGVEIVFRDLIIPAKLRGHWPPAPSRPPARLPARKAAPPLSPFPSEEPASNPATNPALNPPLAPEPFRARTEACLQTWDMPVIHSDGSVLPCCAQSGPEFSLGNIFEEPFEKIWNSPLAVAMRRYLKTGKAPRRKIPCIGCGINPHRPGA